MLLTHCPSPIAILAAAHPFGTAVALTEPSAAIVAFQRQPPSQPPAKNVNSAASPLLAAVQFSGNDAITAKFANLLQFVPAAIIPIVHEMHPNVIAS